MNQYIYFSSKNSDNPNDAHSDFAVNFSNPIVIPPYAEVRCINCRINPNNNVYNIVKDENDRLAFAVSKWWVTEDGDTTVSNTFVKNPDIYQNGFPLFCIKLKPGNYDLENGTDINYHLNAQIEHAINREITNIPNIRNGVTCDIDANKIITIKVSLMGNNGYYQIPDGVNLPQDLLDKMSSFNSRKTIMSRVDFSNTTPSSTGKGVMSSPFNLRGVAPAADMIPPNQVSEYDVTCDTLAGGNFVVGDTIEIVADTSITAKVTAVAANLPTQIEIYQTSDLWKTDEAAANVNIQKTGGGITCRITAYTSGTPDWRGVNLYAIPNDEEVDNDCKYFISTPTTWNSLGDWDNTTQYKLASIFTIDLSSYANETNDDTFRFVYSCFSDASPSMNRSANTTGLELGEFSGSVCPYDYGEYDNNGNWIGTIPYDFPDSDADDILTKTEQDELLPDMTACVYRIQLQKPDGLDAVLKCKLKARGYDKDTVWTFDGYTDVGGNVPQDITISDADFPTTKLCFETYVTAGVANNSNLTQLVIKKKVGAGAWTTVLNVRDIVINNTCLHMDTHRTDTTVKGEEFDKMANIRFSYSHNAPLTKNTTGDNFKSFDKIYFANAYNPIGEANGFVGGAFRTADYITSRNTNLQTHLPVQIYGENELREASQNYIATENPSAGTVVAWEQEAESDLETQGGRSGEMLGLDEQGFQFVNSNSFTTGLVFAGDVNLNERDFPQHYLDCPDLAVKNHTGTCNGTGRPNHFICPLELGSSNLNSLHTSQNETLLYNDLGNAYEERLTRLRLRICDIEGTPSQNLGAYTFGCLEVRENPAYKQAKMLRAIMRGEENATLDYQNALQPSKRTRFQ